MERQPDSHELEDGDDGPTTVAVIAALSRLLESDELRSSGRSRDFLAYVVTETLAGRGERLKERTVARYALGRGEDFDATSNATARVQASRLRTSMARYYSGSGGQDTVVIDIPRGTYVPTFSTRDHPGGGRSHTALRPGIAVVRFADLREGEHRDPMPVALSESVARALSSFPELRVIGPVTTDESGAGLLDAAAVARSFDVEYVLAGAVRATTDVLRLTIRVCDGATGAVLWSEQYDQQRGGVGGFEDEDDLVLRVAATVGDVRGVVRRDVEKHLTVAPGPSGQAAVLAFYRFAESGSRSDTQSAASSLLEAVDVEPDNVVLLAMAGWVHCVLGIMGWAPPDDGAVATAERLAARALALDSTNAHAHQVLAGVALFRGLTDSCRTHALRAVELNPANASLLYTSGVLLLFVDDWQGGIERIRESTRLNPYHPGFQHVFLGIDRLLVGDHAAALTEASLLRNPDDLWGPLLRCLALAGSGYEENARHELDAALTIEPRLLDEDAAFVTQELKDAPSAARAHLRRTLVAWTRSHGHRPEET